MFHFKKILVGFLAFLLLNLPFINVAFSITDTGRLAGTSAEQTMPEGATKPFHIEFRNTPIKDALRFLARIVSMNLVIPEHIDATVSVTLENTPIIDAINAITKSNGLDYALERGILRVGKSESFTASGEDLKTEIIRLKYALASTMTEKIKSLMTSRGSVLADERTNSLVMRETLSNLENVKRFVESVDVKDAQVLIEGRLVEATRDWSRDLGVQWGVTTTSVNNINFQGVSAVGTSDAGRRLNVDLPASTAPTSGVGILIGTLAGGTNVDLALSAGESRGDLHVISEPSIVTSNGVAAHIRSGETIYVKTAGSVAIGGASAAGDSGIEQINTGVELNVTPQISVGDFIKMQIDATTSSPDFTRTVDGIPAIIENKANTTVLVRNGETTVIGGLIKFRGQDTTQKVPFLGDVPLLGYLFQSRQRAKTNNELLVFIRPRIIEDYVPSDLMDEQPRIQRVRDSLVLEEKNKPKELKSKHEYRQRKRSNSFESTSKRHSNRNNSNRYQKYRESYGE